MTINNAATARLTGHHAPAAAANPDPPYRKHRVMRTLTLHMSTFDRLDLWQHVSDTDGQTTISVPRKQLIHLLLDHAHMLERLGRLLKVTEPIR